MKFVDFSITQILREINLITILGYMFEEHTMIRRAAVQCWTNLCTSSQMVTRAEGKNDLVKYSVLLCGDDDDPAIVQAASGALAMLTSQSKKICNKVFDVSINHSVEIMEIYLHIFLQKIRQSNVFTKEVTKDLISRNILFCRVSNGRNVC